MGSPVYQNDSDPGPATRASLWRCTHASQLEIPYRWRTQRTVLVNSMSNLVHLDVPLEFIRQVFEVMADTPRHTYQILTKRSKRLAALAGGLEWPANVWIGVSSETRRYAFRIDHLRLISVAARFVSAEPLLGPFPGP